MKTKSKMNWNRLTENLCPHCEKDLQWDEAGNLWCSCSFQISATRFHEIVEHIINDRYAKAKGGEINE